MAEGLADVMAWGGFVSFDEMGGDRAALPYQSGGTTPTAVTGGPWSGHGAQYTQTVGGAWTEIFEGPTTGKRWHYFAFTGVDTPADDEFTLFYNHFQPSDATGKIRIIRAVGGKLGLRYFDGASWLGPNTAATITWTNAHYLRLETDIAGKLITLVWTDSAGNTETIATGTGTIVPIHTPTPCIEVVKVSGKGAGTAKFNLWELFTNDASGAAPTTGQPYTSAATDYHCFGNFSETDVTALWTPTGCTTRNALNVNDPQSGAAKGNNRNAVTGNGTNLDDLYEITDQSGASATVEAIYIAAFSTDSGATDFNAADKLLAAVPSESATPTAYAGTFVSSFNRGRYKFLATTPSLGTAWTKALFNELRGGYRNDSAATAERVYCYVVGTLGKSQAVPGAAAACPAAAASLVIPRRSSTLLRM